MEVVGWGEKEAKNEGANEWEGGCGGWKVEVVTMFHS